MRKSVLLVAATSLLGLSACASNSGGLFGRGAPDEFQVSRQAPLVVPPDFSLVPPQPGAPRPTDSAADQTLQALFGGPAQRSAAERGTIQQAGGNRAEAGIRTEAGDPETNTVDKGTVTRDIIVAPQGAGQNATADTPQN